MMILLALITLIACPLFAMDDISSSSSSVFSGSKASLIFNPYAESLKAIIDSLPPDIQSQYFIDCSKHADTSSVLIIEGAIGVLHKNIPDLRIALMHLFLEKDSSEIAPLLIYLCEYDPLQEKTVRQLDNLFDCFISYFKSSSSRTFSVVEKLPHVFSRVVELYIRQSKIQVSTMQKGFCTTFTLKKRKELLDGVQNYAKIFGNNIQSHFAKKWLIESIKRIPLQISKNKQKAHQAGQQASLVIGAVADLIIHNNIGGAFKKLYALKDTVEINKKWFDVAYTVHRTAKSCSNDPKLMDDFIQIVRFVTQKKTNWKIVFAAVEALAEIAHSTKNPAIKQCALKELKTLQSYSLAKKINEQNKTYRNRCAQYKNYVQYHLNLLTQSQQETLLDYRAYADNQICESSDDELDDQDVINNSITAILNIITNVDLDITVKNEQITNILNQHEDNSVVQNIVNHQYHNHGGKSPVHLSLTNGGGLLVPLFISKGSSVTQKDDNGDTAAHLAIMNDQLEALKLIILADKNVLSVKNDDNETPAAFAKTVGKPEIAGVLVKTRRMSNDANIEQAFNQLIQVETMVSDDQPFSSTSSSSSSDPVEPKLSLEENKKKALLDLFKAAIDGNFPGMQKALSGGADINGHTADNYTAKKRTALHLVALHGHSKLVTYLLLQGVQVNPQDYNGLTPRAIAHSKGFVEQRGGPYQRVHYEISDLLGSSGGTFITDAAADDKPTRMLWQAAQKGNLTNIKNALEFGAKINGKFQNDYVPVIYAVVNRHKDVVKLLLEGGAWVNSRARNGNTVFHQACLHHIPMIQVVALYGPDRNLKNNKNQNVHNIVRRTLWSHIRKANITVEGWPNVDLNTKPFSG